MVLQGTLAWLTEQYAAFGRRLLLKENALSWTQHNYTDSQKQRTLLYSNVMEGLIMVSLHVVIKCSHTKKPKA